MFARCDRLVLRECISRKGLHNPSDQQRKAVLATSLWLCAASKGFGERTVALVRLGFVYRGPTVFLYVRT